MTRIETFTDAAFAFAVTLLVIAPPYNHALRQADALDLDATERLEARGEREVVVILAGVGAVSAVVARAP